VNSLTYSNGVFSLFVELHPDSSGELMSALRATLERAAPEIAV
jgi:hypothetical protein